MFLRNSPQAIDIRKTDKIGPHEVIAYIKEQGKILSKLDHRISDHHGNILSEHPHIHKRWEEAGRNEYDLDKDKIFVYKGKIDKSGRFITNK